MLALKEGKLKAIKSKNVSMGRRSSRQGCNPAGESPAVAAGKAAVQRVKVPSCQLLVSDT